MARELKVFRLSAQYSHKGCPYKETHRRVL
jgi:hypothetical protein